jgi:ubiquinone/menaquinone biosynthesis C-methylase UbiE
MPLLARIPPYLGRLFRTPLKEAEPAKAYDLWAASYDHQPGNLILALEAIIFSRLLDAVPLEGGVVADIGCGTGRHWEALYARRPDKLLGFDVSSGMLAILKKKYPLASCYLSSDYRLEGLENGSCSCVVSTLALAHMPDFRPALKEWDRILAAGGDILLTDFHPEALKAGGKRTFGRGRRLMAVKSHIHPLTDLLEFTRNLGWECLTLEEKKVSADLLPFFRQAGALRLYEDQLGAALVFGIHLKKSHGTP